MLTEAAVAEMRDALKGGGVMDDLRLHAYYYSFAPTFQREVDLILHAVALAGLAFHHTSQWADDEMEGFYEHCEGDTCEQWIQNAANKAAAELATLRARVAELERDAERWRAVSAMMTHEHHGDACGWTLSQVLPGDDPETAVDALRAATGGSERGYT